MTMWPDAYVRGLQEENARLRAEKKQRIIEGLQDAVADPETLRLAFLLNPVLAQRLRDAMEKKHGPLTQEEKIASRKRWDAMVEGAST